MSDLCMEALGRMFSVCASSPCSESCCRELGFPLRHGCDPDWANAHAHFVLSKRNVPCQRSCSIKPVCFLFGDDSPCFDEVCEDLFRRGRLSRTCHDRIVRRCSEMGIVSPDCEAFRKAVDRCGAESNDWANCAAIVHSTNHFLLELKSVRDAHRAMMDVSKHATEWHSKFGYTATPLEQIDRCVLRFRTTNEKTRMVPCAFTTSVSHTDLTPVVYFDSVLSVVLFVATFVVFWIERR